MKKIILFALNVMALTTIVLMASSCSLGRLFREETHREQARIYMNDGTVLSGRAVLPNLESKYLYLYLNRDAGTDASGCSDLDGQSAAAKTGGRLKLKASEISVAEFWDKKHPEVHNSFIYRDFTKNGQRNETKNGKRRGPFWMKLAGSGKHLDLCLCGAYYSFDNKGNIRIEAAAGDDVYIIGFKDGGKGEFVGFAGSSAPSLRSVMIKWLADDPVLCMKLHEREIGAKDYEVICNEYVPRSDQNETTAI
ncbi:MAG: hypothetical protein ACI3ZQ_10645 [Candidatus Cryptobacteroides sp.]